MNKETIINALLVMVLAALACYVLQIFVEGLVWAIVKIIYFIRGES